MADITASMVKELREKTDAPMMECKKALVEAEGDLAKAEEILRVRLGNKAAKSATRVAAEGVIAVYLSPDAKLSAMVEVNCETDFVAKNPDFLAFANTLAQLVAEKDPADVNALSALVIEDKTVEETRVALSGKIGENMSIRRFIRTVSENAIAQYVHGKKIGVTVDYKAADPAVGKDVAMQIAASKPLFLSKADVPADVIEKERQIYKAQAAESGKPEKVIAAMVEGRIGKYFAEIALLHQQFVKNPDQTVEQMLKSKDAQVSGFTMYVVGEGIEKRSNDFAAEVAAQAAAARS